jgi:hypothetical protein
MTSKKWLAGAIAAVSLTTIAGTSAFALQDGGDGGGGGGGGAGGDVDLDFTSGDADVDNSDACDNNTGGANGEARQSCRGFNARAGSGRATARAGNGGRGGAGGNAGRGGDRTSIRRAGGGFPF